MTALSGVESSSTTARIFELDVLRGIAILLVLGVHSPAERGASGLLRPLDGLIHQFGWTGVDLFFVLSGFLIGRLLLAEVQATGTLQVGRFLIRRMFRIWPAYYLLLLYVLVRSTFELPGGFQEALRSVLPAVFHLQNFIPAPRDQLWSLAVEEHFYLALPFLLALLVRRGIEGRSIHWMPYLCAGLAVLCLALRIVFRPLGVDVRGAFSLDALFFGVNLAYLSRYRPELLTKLAGRRRTLLGLGVLLLLPGLTPNAAVRQTIGATSVYLGYGLILVAFVHRLPHGGLVERWKATRVARLVALTGSYSYSIYLWHRDTSFGAFELTRDLSRAIGLPAELVWVLHTLAYVVASILGGVLMDRLIEVPVLRLRDRLFPATDTSGQVSDAPSMPPVGALPLAGT